MGEHRRRDREPELLGRLEVDHQLNLPWAEITGAAGTAGLFFIRPSRRAGKSAGETRAASGEFLSSAPRQPPVLLGIITERALLHADIRRLGRPQAAMVKVRSPPRLFSNSGP